jgi:hypothetical protein
MKKTLLAILLLGSSIFAQNEYFVVGGGTNLYSPFGTLADRFEPTVGFELMAGKQISEDWTWTGKLEYLKLTEANHETFTVQKDVDVNNELVSYNIPLGNIDMELEIIGLTANASYNLYTNNFLHAKLNFGFGLFKWNSARGSYYDSLFVDTTGTGQFKLAEVLDVPAVSQSDWSGGFNFGLEVSANIFGPAWIYVSGDYMAVVAELFPTLNLNLENVSTFQMLNGRAGIRLKL